MNVAYLKPSDFSFFCDATKQINHIITNLQFAQYHRDNEHGNRDNEHGNIEQYIQKESFEVLHCLFQGYLDHREASEEIMSNVHTDEGVHLNHIKQCTKRKLTTLFGDVTIKRKATVSVYTIVFFH